MTSNSHLSIHPLLCGGLLITASVLFRFAHAEGGIVTDGSIGPGAATLSLPGDTLNVTINQNSGETIGNNLFHSFAHFNINSGQTVTFTENSANSVSNVISRVTGGSSSNINGKLISTPGGQANFYLINPAGIVFGQGAVLDVAGAFHASTADELQFADGGKFSATNPQASSLSLAAPSAFGFLAHTAANNGLLRVESATLEVKPGQTLDLVAGQIEANNATLGAAQKTVEDAGPQSLGREIRLVAVQGSGTVGLDRAGGVLPLVEATPSATNAGDISLHDTRIIASGNGGGRIGIWGGNVNASTRDSSIGINAVNTGSTSATSQQGIALNTGDLTLDGITVSAQTQGMGNAGQVNVEANNVRIDGGALIYTQTDAQGDAGDVAISAKGELALHNTAAISSLTTFKGNGSPVTAKGNGGQINVKAGTILMDGGSQIISGTLGDGNAGRVNVDADKINMRDSNTLIASNSAWIPSINGLKVVKGNAGDVSVNVGTIRLDRNSGIASMSTENSSGNVGKVTVNAQAALSMNDHVGIISHALGTGHADQINVVAENISISGESRISSGTSTYNKAASVNVRASKINIQENSSIDANALPSSKGDAGIVSVIATNELTMDAGGKIAAFSAGTGNAGQINVEAETIQLDNNAIISSRTVNQGNAGSVTVKADSIKIGTASSIDSSARRPSIGRVDKVGNAGTVNVNAKYDLTITSGGAVSTQTFVEGNAGAVQVEAGAIKIDGVGSSINSNAQSGSKGNAGNVKVISQNKLSLDNGGSINSNTFSQGDAGAVEVEAETIEINGLQELNYLTGISSTAENGIRGNAEGRVGSVTVTATKELLMQRSQISVQSQVNSDNPEKINSNLIRVSAPQINLNQSGIIAASTGNIPASAIEINTDQLTLKGESQITTAANQGNGGPISINAKDWLFLNNSQITTSVTGKNNGNGGDISLNGDVLIMDSGFIQANTDATNASGGNINLKVKQLVAGGDNLQRGGSTPLTFIPNSGFNVIQAASPTGLNGNITITAPQLNIVGALVKLNSPRSGFKPCWARSLF